MRTYRFGGGQLVICEETERVEEAASEPGYYIQRVHPHCAERSAELLRSGFRFHDRYLLLKIVPPEAPPAPPLPDMRIRADCEYTEEMLSLAFDAFTTDRRFHLNWIYQQNLANQMIRAYLQDCASRKMAVIKVERAGELLGYTVLQSVSTCVVENVLGVTKSGMGGMLAATFLYAGTLDYISRSGNAGTRVMYRGRVSSGNQASLNLHTHFNAKVRQIYDEYILKRESPLGV